LFSKSTSEINTIKISIPKGFNPDVYLSFSFLLEKTKEANVNIAISAKGKAEKNKSERQRYSGPRIPGYIEDKIMNPLRGFDF